PKELTFARCCSASPEYKVTAEQRPDRAKLSFDGLCRQSPSDLPFSRPALAPVPIPVTTATFPCFAPTRTEFCTLDSRFRDCPSRDVAHSDRDCDLGATATCRVIELVSPSNMDRRDRDVPSNG